MKSQKKIYIQLLKQQRTQEKSLVDEAKKLEQLEKQGQELYSQILQEGKDHNEAVVKKLEQATANVDDREKY